MVSLNHVTNGVYDAIRRAYHASGAPPYDVMTVGPQTDVDMVRHYQDTGRLAIWSGASDNTIYGCCQANWMYRAWHDWCHIISGVCNRMHGPLGCFEPSAEQDVTSFQLAPLGTAFAEVVKCDTAGQTSYYGLYEKFVPRQDEFVLHLLNRTGHHDVLALIDTLGRFK